MTPFKDYAPHAVVAKIVNGLRPSWPTDNELMTNEIWDLMVRCWGKAPQSRPEMSIVLQELAPMLLQSLRPFPGLLPKFQVALHQLYDSIQQSSWIDYLPEVKLKEFFKLLDDVRKLFQIFMSQNLW